MKPASVCSIASASPSGPVTVAFPCVALSYSSTITMFLRGTPADSAAEPTVTVQVTVASPLLYEPVFLMPTRSVDFFGAVNV